MTTIHTPRHGGRTRGSSRDLFRTILNIHFDPFFQVYKGAWDGDKRFDGMWTIIDAELKHVLAYDDEAAARAACKILNKASV